MIVLPLLYILQELTNILCKNWPICFEVCYNKVSTVEVDDKCNGSNWELRSMLIELWPNVAVPVAEMLHFFFRYLFFCQNSLDYLECHFSFNNYQSYDIFFHDTHIINYLDLSILHFKEKTTSLTRRRKQDSGIVW